VRRYDGMLHMPWWYVLLLIPYVAILWVSYYAGATPQFAGIPFFYWYQFLWILISAVLTAIVYFATREPESAVNDPEGSPVGEFK
jgi:membrane protein implicated in regulation of membrane protease activity